MDNQIEFELDRIFQLASIYDDIQKVLPKYEAYKEIRDRLRSAGF